jgi:pimeloyl-ACP methyl ester carboxylesterase
MNAFDHYKVEIDGIPIHFMRRPGAGPRPLPILLLHGWPWTFWDFKKVVGPLADPTSHGGPANASFDVIVPSLPGFGFSSPLTVAGIHHIRIADLLCALMVNVLGYERFGVHGSDWGALISGQLGHKYPMHVVAINTTGTVEVGAFNVERPWVERVHKSLPSDPKLREQMIDRERRFLAHVAVQQLEPQTLSYAMHDSPVGLAAWLVQRRQAWSDCGGDVESQFSKDDLLTSASLYWLTDTFASAAHLYYEARFSGWRPVHGRRPVVEVPVGVSLFGYDAPPDLSYEWLFEYYNVVRLYRHFSGGHFAAAEEPELVVQDVRDLFSDFRYQV